MYHRFLFRLPTSSRPSFLPPFSRRWWAFHAVRLRARCLYWPPRRRAISAARAGIFSSRAAGSSGLGISQQAKVRKNSVPDPACQVVNIPLFPDFRHTFSCFFPGVVFGICFGGIRSPGHGMQDSGMLFGVFYLRGVLDRGNFGKILRQPSQPGQPSGQERQILLGAV